MLIEEVHAYYGSWADLARKLGFGSTTYQKWLKAGFIPMKTQELIELRTKGELKAQLEHSERQKGEINNTVIL